MMAEHHAIYIPGIGDHKPYYQPQIIKYWKRLGVSAHYHPVTWRSQDENFETKLKKLVELIDELHSQGHNVSLVGVSAGASAAFNAYMARKDKIARVVYVCGKLQRPETIGSKYYAKNPSFKESLALEQQQLKDLSPTDTKKMLSLKPLYDQTVPVRDTEISGVRNWTMLSAWHVPSIFMGISAYGPIICSFIKKEEK